MIDVLEQTLWLNQYVKRANIHWNVTTAINEGLNQVRDIYDTINGRFRTYAEITTKYGPVISLASYHSLIACIPNWWKIALNQRIHVEKTEVGIERLRPGQKITNWVYCKQVEGKITKQDACKGLWEHDLQINIENWQQIVIDSCYISTWTKLKYLQYRLLNRILTTNLSRASRDETASP